MVLCRKQIGEDILTGYARPSKVAIIAVNGRKEKFWGSSVLTVEPTCTLAWVPYTARSALPVKALQCGHLTAVGHVYCARVWRPDVGRMFFGYYPVGKKAYYAHHVALGSSKMDILTKV